MTNHMPTINDSLEEIFTQLMKRDAEDAEISKVNYRNLIAKGLKPIQPKHRVSLETDEIVGAHNVASHLLQFILPDDKVIALEGLSGVGKGTTAHELKIALPALVMSFGEVFRYLTYMEYVHHQIDHRENLSGISHRLEDGALHLDLDGDNISRKLEHHLQDPYLSSQVPSIAAKTQDLVIRFFKDEIVALKKICDARLILEGRDYTLDFLPCDLRIELVARPIIRAKRRMNQQLAM